MQEHYTEEWRDIKDYEGLYQISNYGRVRSLTRTDSLGRIWKGKIRTAWFPKGKDKHYPSIMLSKNSKKTRRELHRLVLEAFVGPCPDGLEGCHQDGDKKNNKLDNLRWDTRQGNFEDNISNGTRMYGHRNPQCKLPLTTVLQIIETYATGKYSQKQVGDMFNISQSHVGQLWRKDRRKVM